MDKKNQNVAQNPKKKHESTKSKGNHGNLTEIMSRDKKESRREEKKRIIYNIQRMRTDNTKQRIEQINSDREEYCI